MVTTEYRDILGSLMKEYCMDPDDIVFVEDVHEWCVKEGVPEPDRKKPIKLIRGHNGGCRMVIEESIPGKVVAERINAMSIRSTLQNVAVDRSEVLNNDKKRLIYLFISEFSRSLPETAGDELLADNWTFDEMKRLGHFKE